MHRGLGFPLRGDRAAQSKQMIQFLDYSPVWRSYVLWDVQRGREGTLAHIGAVNMLVWTPRKVRACVCVCVCVCVLAGSDSLPSVACSVSLVHSSLGCCVESSAAASS